MSPQAKRPSLGQDLLMLGDAYLTLGWVAIQRLRHGLLWPWDARPKRPAAILTMRRPQNEAPEEHETATRKRG